MQFEAQGLQPFTTYYYQFNICNSNVASVVGRTKTIPAKDDKVTSNIKLAINHSYENSNPMDEK